MRQAVIASETVSGCVVSDLCGLSAPAACARRVPASSQRSSQPRERERDKPQRGQVPLLVALSSCRPRTRPAGSRRRRGAPASYVRISARRGPAGLPHGSRHHGRRRVQGCLLGLWAAAALGRLGWRGACHRVSGRPAGRCRQLGAPAGLSSTPISLDPHVGDRSRAGPTRRRVGVTFDPDRPLM